MTTMTLPMDAGSDESTAVRPITRRANWWGEAGLLLILVVYAIFIGSHFAPAISGPDDNGYWAQGSLLVNSGHTWFVPESKTQYIGMHWLLTPSGEYVSRYPPGLAVLIGVVYKWLGWKTSVMINPALSVLALIGMYLLSRRLMPVIWAIFAVAVLASNPTFDHHALQSDSHMAVLFCGVWGMYLLIGWSQEGRMRQIFLAGVLLGCIPTIRYPDAVMAIAIGIFLLLHLKSWPRIGWHYAAAIAGALIPVVPLLLRNQLLLGAFWRTGYALTNEQTGFSFAYFKAHAIDYIRLINSDGLGPLFAIGLTGITCMICSARLRATGILLALMCLPMLLLYMAYYWAPNMGLATMRFLLPTFPCVILAGAWMLREATRYAPRSATIAIPTVLLVSQMLWSTRESLAATSQLGYQNQMLARLASALDDSAPRGSVVLASNQIAQDLDFVRHWKLVDESIVRGGGFGMRGPGGPGAMFGGDGADAPSPMQEEKRVAQQKLYTGTTTERQKKFVDDIRIWADGKEIYLVGSEREIKQGLASTVSGADSIQIVKRVPMPKAPEINSGRGGMGGPGGNRRGNFGGMRGPGGGPGGGGPGGGGPFGMGNYVGESELVIAEWKLPAKEEPVK